MDISFDEGDSIDDPPYSPRASLVSSDSDTADMELSHMEVSDLEEPVKQRAWPKQRRPHAETNSRQERLHVYEGQPWEVPKKGGKNVVKQIPDFGLTWPNSVSGPREHHSHPQC